MTNNILAAVNAGMADVLAGVRASLVQITNGRRGRDGAGAGTIWHADGLIVTNAHVVRNRRHLNVTLADGRTFPARVLAQNDAHDIAALKIDAHDLPTIELGNSRDLTAGSLVFAAGHPWGVTGAVSAGIVITDGAELPRWPNADREWLAVDLRLRPGNSGGPLVDGGGRLVGLNTIMNGPEVGLAVPVHVIKAWLKQTLDSERGETPPLAVPQHENTTHYL